MELLLKRMAALAPTFELAKELKLATLSTRLPELSETDNVAPANAWLDEFDAHVEAFKQFYRNLSPEKWEQLTMYPNQPHYKTLKKLALVMRAAWIDRPELLKKRSHKKKNVEEEPIEAA